MKRFLTRVVPLLATACMTDTPMPDGSDDRLGENLEAWCDSTCARLSACDSEVGADCSADCMQYFDENFVGKSEACEAGATRVMDCIEAASCSELQMDDVCNTQAEADRCAGSEGRVVCRVTSGGGSVGGAGGVGGSTGMQSCFMELGECSDGKTYGVSCEGSERSECSCSIDGEITGSYTMVGAGCPEDVEAKRICGWPMAPSQGEPAPVACRVSAGSGSAGGGPVGECEMFFDECSDGRSYGITCGGPAGETTCTCTVDGEAIASPRPPVDVCPHALEPDSGAAALNYACNFSIAPIMLE